MIFCCTPNCKAEVKIIWIENEAKNLIFAPFSVQIIFAPTLSLDVSFIILEKIDFYMVLNSCEKILDRSKSLNPREWATPIYMFSRYGNLRFSAPDDCKNLTDSAKCSQWPCLY